MEIFESKATINKPVNEVYSFLADMNNHGQLMPDSVQEWASTTDEANFSVQNMLKLKLRIEERVENSSIKILPFEKPPFALELDWVLSPNNNQTDIVYTIQADLNMMMKMMASGPLQKLVNHEVETLAALLG